MNKPQSSFFAHACCWLLLSAATTALIGCDNQSEQQNANAQQAAPTPKVKVVSINPQAIPQYQTFSGRTSAYQTAEVRPQVTGVVEQVLFREGSQVKQGDNLYKINVDNYVSSVASGQSAIAQAEANLFTAKAAKATAQANLNSQMALLAQAQADLGRYQQLVEQDAISHQQYDQATTQVRTAQAGVESAKAAVQQAQAGIDTANASIAAAKANLSASQLDLSRTIVKAPISGITSRSEVTAGALVNANQAQPLVTIANINPIYVDISQSSADMLKLRQQLTNGEVKQGINAVELVLEDGSTYPMTGKLALREAQVDEQTGAVTLRAIFENPNGVLLPGMYVTARLAQTVLPSAVLLPQSAIIRTPAGQTQVYVVDANKQIQAKDVVISGTMQGQWIIQSGLNQGDKVVIEGGSQVKPEQTVQAELVNNTQSTVNPTSQANKTNGSAPLTPKQAQKQMQTQQNEGQ